MASVSSSSSLSSRIMEIQLPGDIEKLDEALFPLRRQIEGQYRTLPWPREIKKIAVLTEVCRGRGDLAAAAKAIALMRKISPDLVFDWVLVGAKCSEYDPKLFLSEKDSSKITIRNFFLEPTDKTPADLLLVGPVKCGWSIDYIEDRISRTIKGPAFGFMENAQHAPSFDAELLQNIVAKANDDENSRDLYQKLHANIFLRKSFPGSSKGLLPMGIQPGTGVFLDQSRLEAPLSRGYCCPSYLSQIEDVNLRKDILEAMDIFDGESMPDYNRYSFNSGYAHHAASWGKFIDCTAIHEKEKNVVLVLNQKGEYADYSAKDFQEQIFTKERLSFLKQKGYGTVRFKAEDQQATLLEEREDPTANRSLTVIMRSSFLPSDMRRMQLASERLLATGDNSAVEAWCARCKLYVYEDVDNMNCKWRFLQQQVDLAQTIHPNLGRLLALFGGDKRLPEPFLNKTLNNQKMAEMEHLLNDPDLSDATLQFCHHIIANYSFDQVLEAALKRTAWHHCLPELTKIEAETLDESFRSGLIEYLKVPTTSDKTLQVSSLQELGRRVQAAVQQYFTNLSQQFPQSVSQI